MNKNPAPSRLLYRLTVISFVVSAFLHAIALFAALGIMQPGLDVEKSVLERAIYVAENATVWRMGWHLWQLVALANLAAAVLLMLYFNNVRRQIASVGRLPFALSILALLFTVAAIIPEQWGEYAFVTSFVEQAREAVRLGNASSETGVLVGFIHLEVGSELIARAVRIDSSPRTRMYSETGRRRRHRS